MDQERRERNKQVLDRIASDPKFREELLDDPRGAMERAGFTWDGGDDVSGYLLLGGTTGPIPVGGTAASDMITCAPPTGGGTSGIVTAVCDPSGGPEKDPGTTTDPPPK